MGYPAGQLIITAYICSICAGYIGAATIFRKARNCCGRNNITPYCFDFFLQMNRLPRHPFTLTVNLRNICARKSCQTPVYRHSIAPTLMLKSREKWHRLFSLLQQSWVDLLFFPPKLCTTTCNHGKAQPSKVIMVG